MHSLEDTAKRHQTISWQTNITVYVSLKYFKTIYGNSYLRVILRIRQEKGISNDIYLYSFLYLLFLTLILPHVGGTYLLLSFFAKSSALRWVYLCSIFKSLCPVIAATSAQKLGIIFIIPSFNRIYLLSEHCREMRPTRIFLSKAST